MISLDQCRKVGQLDVTVSDVEVIEARDMLYRLAELALEDWMNDKKFPTSDLVTRRHI